MRSKHSLVQTNPYLKNPKKRADMINRSVITSTAIEGVDVSHHIAHRRSTSSKNKE